MQYSILNLNAFILIIAIGYSLYCYIENDKYYNKDKFNYYNNNNSDKLKDRNNSPIQLVSQLKGYYYMNPMLALSLSITLFSFVGVPPLIGFFAKQMVLSAALDNGYIFMSLIAILTSVISAVYYLSVIKQIFFDKPDYNFNPALNNLNLNAFIKDKNIIIKKIKFSINDITISSYLSIIISTLTLITLVFMFIPQE
jgi:NADH-ubiquinone oxidoreductase chain 2